MKKKIKDLKRCLCEMWNEGLKFDKEKNYYQCKKCKGFVSVKLVEEHYP